MIEGNSAQETNNAATENSPQIAHKSNGRQWALIGCGLMVLFMIALFIVIFWIGTEGANPWGESPVPGP